MLRLSLALFALLTVVTAAHAQTLDGVQSQLSRLKGEVRALESLQYALLGFIAVKHGSAASGSIVDAAKVAISEDLQRLCDPPPGNFQPSASPVLDDARKLALKKIERMMRFQCRGAHAAIGRAEEAVRLFKDERP